VNNSDTLTYCKVFFLKYFPFALKVFTLIAIATIWGGKSSCSYFIGKKNPLAIKEGIRNILSFNSPFIF
ncbi:hypothetical protein, partial [Aliivibrio fischeri]|uniref:hypothetical protein n=1 Tax=Aliivibrio fischeri TaxID=668 RepID=UPI001BDF23E9